MNIPLRATRHLAGLDKAVMPKAKLYECARDLFRLRKAISAGYKSWEEYQAAREIELERFYQELSK